MVPFEARNRLSSGGDGNGRFDPPRSPRPAARMAMAPGGSPGLPRRVPRVVLYSHDTEGLGHIRRNLLIARCLSETRSAASILVLSGVREAAAFAMPQGVDVVTLPALGKDTAGQYHSRSLGVSLPELVEVRQHTLSAALNAFTPDIFIVDKVPLGAFDELAPALAALRERGRTRMVLGLRDVLDDPETVRREWRKNGYRRAIERFYDQVWVYGDPKVFDTMREYDFGPDIAAKARYTGYLDPRSGPATGGRLAEDLPAAPSIVCAVGGGRDGERLATAFLESDLPSGRCGIVLTGPLMAASAREQLRSLARRRGRRTVLEFITDPRPLLKGAERVICMGGYNTTCEVLALRRQALIVPRVTPRTEQLIRAERLAALGLVDVLHPDRLSPRTITEWLARPVETRAVTPDVFDFGGRDRIPRLMDEMLGAESGYVHAI